MPPALTRESLESMKRVDLQKLCKDYGVKANLKTEALIDLVLDATSQPMPKPEPNSPQLPPPSKRTTSVRVASTRSTNAGQSRLRSGGFVATRDIIEGDEPTTQSKPDTTTKIPQPTSQPPPPPVTRTRKAKETQLRLGVGRPKVVGGAGARAVTKSFSLSKNSKRVSKSVKISEAVIPEEQDFEHQSPTTNPTTPPPVAQTTIDAQGPPHNFDKINEYMQGIVRPLQEQIQHFQSEFERLSLQVSELTNTKSKLSDEVEQLRDRADSAEDRLEKMSSEFGEFMREATAREQTLEAFVRASIVYPPTSLGKRPRDSPDSEVDGNAERNFQDGDAHKLPQPQKKRIKVSDHETDPVAGPSRIPGPPGRATTHKFIVYTGEEEKSEYDPPPPTTHLSDMLGGRPSPITPHDLQTTTASTAENQPFGIHYSAFQAATSTPVHPGPGFASYLARPESPTSHVVERIGRRDEASPFLLSGLPPGLTDTRAVSSSSRQRSANPESTEDGFSALLRTPPLHPIHSHPSGNGEASSRLDDTPAFPMKTIYGTELESDTRFGDFGVEGMATSYWQKGQRRF